MILQFSLLFALSTASALTIQAYPNLPGTSSTDLVLQFNLPTAVYSGTTAAISFTSNPPSWLPSCTCWLSVTQGSAVSGSLANVGRCETSGQSLILSLESGDPNSFAGACLIYLKNAVRLPSQGPSGVSIELSFYGSQLGSKINGTLNYANPSKTQITNSTVSFGGEMTYSLASLDLTFSLNSTLDANSLVMLQFDNNYDSYLGVITTDAIGAQMSCNSSISTTLTCAVKARSLLVTFGQTLSPNSQISLTVSNFRLPSTYGQIILTLLDSSGDTIASSPVNISTVNVKPLDLSCCYSFNPAVLNNCTSQEKSICKSFGGLGGDYTSDMNIIVFQFQQEMKMRSPAYCADYFAPQTLSILGTDPLCFWRSKKEFRLYLGANPSIRSQDAYFKGDFLNLNDGGKSIGPVSIFVSYPQVAWQPVAVITGPSRIPAGMNVPFECSQSRNTGRRYFDCYWNASNGTASITSLGSTFLLPGNLSGTLTVNLRVVNFMNLTNSISTIVSVAQDLREKFSVSLIPSNIKYYFQSATIQLGSQVVVESNTGNLGSTIWAYNWKVQDLRSPDKQIDLSLCNSGRTCLIPPNSLVKSTYNVTLNVSSGQSTGFANLTIELNPTPIVLIVIGGNRTVSSGSSNVLFDASRSFDPDNLGAISFDWHCEDSNNSQCVNTTDSKSSTFSIPIPQSQDNIYTITLNYSAQYRDLLTEKLTLTIVNKPVPNIQLVPPSKPMNPVGTNVVSAKWNSGTVNITNTNLNYVWSITDIQNISKVLLSPPSGNSIMIAPNTLDFGRSYTFTVTETNLNISTSIVILVNSPPVGGIFLITPQTGKELLDNFTLQASSWLDLESDYPLYYQFLRVQDDGSKEELSPVMLSYTVSTILAMLNKHPNVTLICNVFDSLNAYFTNKAGVILEPSALNSAGVSSQASALLQSADNVPNPGSLLMAVSALADYSSSQLKTSNSSISNTLSDVVVKSLSMSSNLTSHDMVAYSNAIGKIVQNPATVNEKSINTLLTAFQTLGNAVPTLERDQGQAVLQTLSGLTEVCANQSLDDSVFDKVNNQVNVLTTALLSKAVPGASAVNLTAPNFSLSAIRMMASPSPFTMAVTGSSPGASQINTSFPSNFTSSGNNETVWDVQLFLDTYLPHNSSSPIADVFHVSVFDYNFEMDKGSLTVWNYSTSFGFINTYPNVSFAGIVSVNVTSPGSVTEEGTVNNTIVTITNPVLTENMNISASASNESLCFAYDSVGKMYRSDTCATTVSSGGVVCSCAVMTTVAILLPPNSYEKALETMPGSNPAEFFTLTLTKWSLSLLFALLFLILFTLAIVHQVDNKTIPGLKKLEKSLKQFEDAMHFELAVQLKAASMSAESDRFGRFGNLEPTEIYNLAKSVTSFCFSLKKLCCRCCRRDERTIDKRNFLKFMEFIREKADSLEIWEKNIGDSEKPPSQHTKEQIISRLKDSWVFWRVFKLYRGENLAVTIDEIDLGLSDDMFKKFDKLMSDTERGTQDVSTGRPSVSGCTKFRNITTKGLNDEVSTLQVNDVIKIDHWWQTMVEKDLTLSLMFSKQLRVTRKVRLVLLWDFILIQLVSLGFFLNDLDYLSRNEQIPMMKLYQHMSESYFWLYIFLFSGVSLVWTTLLEFLMDISPRKVLQEKPNLLLTIMSWLSWVLGILTLLSCLGLIVFLANGYSDDDYVIAEWMMAFGISLVKDVFLMMHLKGILYIVIRKLWCPIWNSMHS